MILCEWDASEGNVGQSCVHLYARILSTSFISVSIFSVWCYSSVSISMSVSSLKTESTKTTFTILHCDSLWSYQMVVHLELEDVAEEKVDVGWSCVHNDVENLLLLDLPSLHKL